MNKTAFIRCPNCDVEIVANESILRMKLAAAEDALEVIVAAVEALAMGAIEIELESDHEVIVKRNDFTALANLAGVKLWDER